jgi:osmotically-inducible protein OsmY
MFALLVIASILSSPVGQVVTGVEDSTITARIESLFLLDQHLNPLNINTTTRDGNVMLSGSVNDEVQRELAEDLALGVRGVRFVDSQLVVINTVVGEKEQRSWSQRVQDRAVTAAVRSRMLGSGEFKGLKIGISTVNNVVTLFGVVPTDAHVESMIGIASNTKGVDEVVNQLTVRTKDDAYDAVRGTGQQISDEWLESRVATAIMLNRHLKLRELDIEVDDGICMLSGTVDSEEKRVLAEQVASNVQGVSEVRNTITVRALGVVVSPSPGELPSGLSGSEPMPSEPPATLEGSEPLPSEPPASLEGSDPPEDDFSQTPSVEAATLGDP